MFDPHALPMPDLGLRCLDCGYPLAHLSEPRCPECGRAVDLDEHIPAGAFPLLIADGEQVRASRDLHELMSAYRLPVIEQVDPMRGMFGVAGGLMMRKETGPPVAVPRERYFEAVDLIRRWRMNEELPPPPEPVMIDGPWGCPACGEENPETFELCWNCGEPWSAA